MSFDVTYDSESDIIRARMEGRVTAEEFRMFATEVVRVASANDCEQLLNDARAAEVKLSTIDIYDIPRLLEQMGMPKTTKRALVVAKEHRDRLSFFETVSFNIGQNLRVFTDLGEAESWLLNR